MSRGGTCLERSEKGGGEMLRYGMICAAMCCDVYNDDK